MATENDQNKKETPADKPTASADTKSTDAEKPSASSPSASDKLSDAAKSAGAIAGSLFTKAKGLADEAIKTAKSDETKQNLNNAAKTAGAIAGKVLAKAKDAAADVKKELGNVNDLRKESFANTEAGTSKKDMAKGFWAKLSGKQKGILAGILAICVYFSYSVLFSGGAQKLTFPESLEVNKNIGGCVTVVNWRSANGKPLSPELRALSVKYQPFSDSVTSKLKACSGQQSFDCAKKTLSPQEFALIEQSFETLAFLNLPQRPNFPLHYETSAIAHCTPLMFMK